MNSGRRQALNAHKEAIASFMEAKRPSTVDFCRRILGNREAAEDIVQECYLRLSRAKIDIVNSKGSFSSLLYKTLTNLCLNSLKSITRKKHSLLLADPVDDKKEYPIDVMIRREQLSRLESAIEGLSDKSKRVLFLKDVEGLSYKKIAQTLNIDISTVGVILHRTRQSLKLAIEETDD